MMRKSSKGNRRNRKVRLGELALTRTSTVTLGKVAADGGTYRIVSLGSLPGFSDMQGLYQEYKIVSVTYRYQLYTPNATSTYFPTVYAAPQMYTLGGAVTSLDDVQQYKDLKVFQFGPTKTEFVITVKPNVSVDINNSGGYGEVRSSPWVSMQNTSLSHMTVVDWIGNYNTSVATTQNNINLITTVKLALRNPR